MNVLLVSTKTTGGAARACLMQFAALSEKGDINTHLLTLYAHDSDVDRLGQKRQSILTTSTSIFAKAKAKAKAVILQWLSKFHDDGVFLVAGDQDISKHPEFIKADIVIFHWCYNFVDFGKLPRNGKTYFWTCHDMAAFNGGIPYHMSNLNWILTRFKKSQERRLKRQLKDLNLEFIFPSKWLKSEFELSDLGKSGMHSHHLPYSSDFTQFPLEQRSRLPKSLCFIAADANNKRKGLDLLLEAVGHLHDPCEIHVIGEFNERMIGSIERHRIVAHGYLSEPQKIANILSEVQAFVIPSRQDNLPNTVIESLSTGTPVVGFRIGGIPDMVKNEVNGILSDELSGHSLSQAISQCLARKWDYNSIRSGAVKKYSHTTHRLTFLDIFSERLTQ